MLDPRVIGDDHYTTARATQKLLQDYKGLQDIIAILGTYVLYVRLYVCTHGGRTDGCIYYTHIPYQMSLIWSTTLFQPTILYTPYPISAILILYTPLSLLYTPLSLY